MSRFLLLVLALLVAAVAAAPASAATKWLCRPGLSGDACAGGLATTSFTPRGERLGVERPKARRTVDCFYVYPTVSDEPGGQASLAIRPEIRSIARYQAARFGQVCRIYAPVYRQLTIAGINGAGGSWDVAYGDVRSAFREYLRRYNHGRGFVLIGHSQGAFHLERLVRQVIEPSKGAAAPDGLGDPARRQRRRPSSVARFQRLPAAPAQLHCVIAYSTFDDTPPADALFGRRVDLRANPVTNPAALAAAGPAPPDLPERAVRARHADRRGISLLDYTQPTAATPWVASPARSAAACCDAHGGANVLRMVARGGTPTLHASPDATWGLHLVDVNVALGDLVDIVARQARQWVGPSSSAAGSPAPSARADWTVKITAISQGDPQRVVRDRVDDVDGAVAPSS